MTDSDPGDINLGLEVFKGFWGKLLQAVLGFAGTIIFARVLGPRSFGGFYLLLSLVMLANRPVMGVAEATKKRISELDANRSDLFGVQLAFNAVVLAVVAISALLLNAPLSSFTGLEHAAVLFVVLFGSIIAFAPTQLLVAGIGRISAPVWIDTLRSVFTFSLQLGLVLLGLGAAGMVFGLSLATLLCVPITLYLLQTMPTRPGMETIRSVWEFARYSIGSRVVGRAYDELDPLLLGFLLTPAAVGFYQVAYKIAAPGMFVTVVASSGLLTKVSNLDSRDQSLSEDVTNTVAFGSILAIPIFFGALAIPEQLIVTAYEAEYAAAAELLIGLTLFTIIRTQSSMLESVVNGIDKPLIVFRASAIALVINVAIGIPLTLQFGPIGVVVATIVAEAFRYCLFFVVIRRNTSAKLLPRPIFEQFIAGIVMFGIVEMAHRSYLAVHSWIELSMLLGVGVIVYFVALGIISTLFRNLIRTVMRDALQDLA